MKEIPMQTVHARSSTQAAGTFGKGAVQGHQQESPHPIEQLKAEIRGASGSHKTAGKEGPATKALFIILDEIKANGPNQANLGKLLEAADGFSKKGKVDKFDLIINFITNKAKEPKSQWLEPLVQVYINNQTRKNAAPITIKKLEERFDAKALLRSQVEANKQAPLSAPFTVLPKNPERIAEKLAIQKALPSRIPIHEEMDETTAKSLLTPSSPALVRYSQNAKSYVLSFLKDGVPDKAKLSVNDDREVLVRVGSSYEDFAPFLRSIEFSAARSQLGASEIKDPERNTHPLKVLSALETSLPKDIPLRMDITNQILAQTELSEDQPCIIRYSQRTGGQLVISYHADGKNHDGMLSVVGGKVHVSSGQDQTQELQPLLNRVFGEKFAAASPAIPPKAEPEQPVAARVASGTDAPAVTIPSALPIVSGTIGGEKNYLGAGSFGNVYSAELQEPSGKTVKVVLKETKAKDSNEKTKGALQRELAGHAAMVGLDHPNIVKVFGITDGPSPAIVLEQVEGKNGQPVQTLAGHVASRGKDKVSSEDRLRWAGQIMDAVAYLEKNGVYHRDLHPNNVLLRPRRGEDGQILKDAAGNEILDAVLADFGLSYKVGGERTVLGQAGQTRYSAPESFNPGVENRDNPADSAGKYTQVVTSQSEAYALGHTLMFVLYGAREYLFFAVEGVKETPATQDKIKAYASHVSSNIVDTGVDRKFLPLVRSMIDVGESVTIDPSQRPSISSAFATFNSLAGTEESHAAAPPVPPRRQPGPGRLVAANPEPIFATPPGLGETQSTEVPPRPIRMMPGKTPLVAIPENETATDAAPTPPPRPFKPLSPEVIHNVSSADAESMLKGQPAGTYLIRESSEPGKFAISLKKTDGLVVEYSFIIVEGKAYKYQAGDTGFKTVEMLAKDAVSKQVGAETPVKMLPKLIEGGKKIHYTQDGTAFSRDRSRITLGAGAFGRVSVQNGKVVKTSEFAQATRKGTVITLDRRFEKKYQDMFQHELKMMSKFKGNSAILQPAASGVELRWGVLHEKDGTQIKIKPGETVKVRDRNGEGLVDTEYTYKGSVLKDKEENILVDEKGRLCGPKGRMLTEEIPGAQELFKVMKGLSDEKKLNVITQILDIMIAVEAKGIVHKDIKPENFLLANGKVFLIDFGFATEATDLARLQRFEGTPGQMAPEFFDKKLPITPITPKVDHFAIGSTIHMILTGNEVANREGGVLLQQIENLGYLDIQRSANFQAMVIGLTTKVPIERMSFADARAMLPSYA